MGLTYAPLKLTNLFSRQNVAANALVDIGVVYVRLRRDCFATGF